MYKDIRSFFPVLSKKGTTATISVKKKRVIEDSSDDDIVASTPNAKKPKIHKLKKIAVISDDDSDVIAPTPEKTPKNKNKRKITPDSEDKTKKSRRSSKSHKPKETLKPTNPSDLFGSAPVKQSNTKHQKKVEDDFKKTLEQLDDDFVVDIDVLDKTIEEALKNGHNGHKSPEKSEVTKTEDRNERKRTEKIENNKTSPAKNNDTDYWNDSAIDPDQERSEKKRHSFILYQKYLKRSGPANRGTKVMPKGKPDCLKNVCFLKTGVLDSMDKDDVDAIVKEHGGRTVSAVSRKVNYLIVGEDAGPAKLDKARGFGIKEISEDEFLDMILIRSGLPGKYVKQSSDEHVEENSHTKECKSEEVVTIKNEEIKKEKHVKQKTPKKVTPLKIEVVSPKDKSKTKMKIDFEPKKTISKNKNDEYSDHSSKNRIKEKRNDEVKDKTKKHDEIKLKKENVYNDKPRNVNEDLKPIKRTPIVISETNKSWTEKYKPSDVKSIIGQQGDKSNMKKLLDWLQNWDKNQSSKNKTKLVKPSPWAKNDDGAYFKCALLSGSPGIGKTTTATLVAQELGFDIVEFNASDTRSKRLLHEEVAQLLSSTSVASYFKDGSAPTKKHVLLMDEVDGMAGNEDRGGMQELINLIKNSSIPIICMCNDRQHPKIRSLVNYCFDLRFVKPRPEQIKGAMMSICFKEGIKISADSLLEVIKGAGGDIRQTLTNLSLWSTGDNISSDLAAKQAKNATKDTILGPWEVIRKVFSEADHKNMNIRDKSRLFFYDYSIGPLFVQENYLQVVPHCPKKEILNRVALAADAISMGDVIDKRIRSTNNWSLLDSQAMFSSVLPGYYMEGHIGGQINFPGWLGKNSKRGKFQRLLSELHAHMRTSISGSKIALNMDYIYHLRNNIVKPLASQGSAGIPNSLEVMKAYNLLREDFDSILELCQWPKQKDPMALVESKVKAAFTRAYNKDGIKLPYAINATAIKKRSAASSQDEIYGNEEEEEEVSNDEDDITKDGMIKEKKKPVTKAKKEPSEASSSKKVEKKAPAKRAKKAK